MSFSPAGKIRRAFSFAAITLLVTGNLFSFYSFQKKKPENTKPAATDITAESFLPMDSGNFWFYRASIEIANDKGSTIKTDVPRRIEIISAKTGEKQTIIQIKNEDHNGSSLITYVTRGNKIYQFDEFDPPGFEKVADLPSDKLRYVFPLSLKQQWGGTAQRQKKDGLYSYVVEAKEDVSVPAGAFHDCFRIAFRTVADDLVEWFVPGVGVVKSTYHHNGTVDDELYELENYNVKNKAKAQ